MKLNNAKIIILQFDGYLDNSFLNFIQDKDCVLVNNTNIINRYIGYPLNEHHFTTKFHYDYVIPILEKLLHFTFDKTQYTLVNNFVTKNNLTFDLSYYIPKDKKYKFNVKGLEYDIEYSSNFDGLLFNDKYEKCIRNTGLLTEYHKLYAFPHSCSIVKNLYKHNGRTLLVSGDSQAIPFIPILCTIFKEVWYFDNRSDMSFKHLLEKANFTDILIEIWKNSVDYYTVKNLK